MNEVHSSAKEGYAHRQYALKWLLAVPLLPIHTGEAPVDCAQTGLSRRDRQDCPPKCFSSPAFDWVDRNGANGRQIIDDDLVMGQDGQQSLRLKPVCAQSTGASPVWTGNEIFSKQV
jgi:hypothetical protein